MITTTLQLSKRITQSTKTVFAMTIAFLLLTAPLYAASTEDILKDAKDGSLSSPIVDAIITVNNPSKASGLISKANAQIANCTTAVSPGSEVKAASAILKKLKKNVLKKFWPGSSLNTTLNQGNYDLFWGTVLFAGAMEKSKLPFKVIETPANFLIAIKSGGKETLFDVFGGMNPIKTTFTDYLTKDRGLRTSQQAKQFPLFSVKSAKRHDPSRLLAGALAKRLLADISDDKYKDYVKTFTSLKQYFPDALMDHDKITKQLADRLKGMSTEEISPEVLMAAKVTAKNASAGTKEVSDVMTLKVRDIFMAEKSKKNPQSMAAFLKKYKPVVTRNLYNTMAKQGYLSIFNYYWKKKEYGHAKPYAAALYKELKIKKAKPFYIKCLLLQTQQLVKAKKYGEGEKLLQEVFSIDKNNKDAKKLVEWILITQYNDYKDKNDYPQMKAVLEKLIKKFPSNNSYRNSMIRTYWTWGDSLIRNNEFDKGTQKLKEGYKRFPDYEPLKELLEASYWNYAVALDKKGKRLKAIEVLKKANDFFGEESSQKRNDMIAALYLRLSIDAANAGKRNEAMLYVSKGLIYAPDNQNLKNQEQNLKRGKASIEQEAIEYAPWE